VKLFIGDGDKIGSEIESLLKLKPPVTFSEKISTFTKLFALKNTIPKKLKNKGECQEIIKLGNEAKLSDLPIITTWEQ
ncbi:menaquinone biosynthesis decarboxylase, partial [Aliarcobacter butzleri]